MLIFVGRGEAFLGQARQALQEAADQTAVELVSLALQDLARCVQLSHTNTHTHTHTLYSCMCCSVSLLPVVLRAARIQPGFECVWKLIGDCCVTLHYVSPSITRLTGPHLPGDLFSLSCTLSPNCTDKNKSNLPWPQHDNRPLVNTCMYQA